MECFTVLADEIEGRIDPSPYHPIRLNAIKKVKSSKYELLPLKEVVEFRRKIVNSKSKDLIYVGLENIESNTGMYIHSEEEKENFGSAFVFQKGDILFPKLRPYLNKVYFAEFDGVCSTEFHVLKPIKCVGLYLFTFLNSQLVVSQTSYLMTGNTLPRLQTDEVKSLIIPIPSKNIQESIKQKIKEAYNQRNNKEYEAQQLLDSINDYVLDELGIKLPELKDRMVYVVNSDEVQNKRVDAYYYQTKFEEVEKAIKRGKSEVKELKEIIDFIPGYAFSSNDYVYNEGIKLLTIRNIKENFIDLSDTTLLPNDFFERYDKFQIKNGDIVIAMTGATIGKSFIFNFDDKVLLNQRVGIIRAKEKLNKYFLLSFIRTPLFKQKILRQSCGGAQPNISEYEITSIKIPLPPLSVQNKIAEEVKKRMQKAEQLQKEAKEELEEAKKEVDRIILGENT